jgi:hypothetical protein
MIQMVLTIGAHWSPLELEIKKRDYAELIQMVISFGAHWSPLESIGVHWSPLESIGVED